MNRFLNFGGAGGQSWLPILATTVFQPALAEREDSRRPEKAA